MGWVWECLRECKWVFLRFFGVVNGEPSSLLRWYFVVSGGLIEVREKVKSSESRHVLLLYGFGRVSGWF